MSYNHKSGQLIGELDARAQIGDARIHSRVFRRQERLDGRGYSCRPYGGLPTTVFKPDATLGVPSGSKESQLSLA